MKEPLYLREGDLIWITAPARKISPKEIEPAIDLLKKWGYRVKMGKTIGLEENQFAGSDTERAGDFQNAMDNPEVKAIWCARGGYGAIRMVDYLNFDNFKKTPKWIIGYSDMTVLHSHINSLSIVSLHAFMPVDLKSIETEALNSLKKVLSGESITYKVPFSRLNKQGVCSGELVGGNLSVLYSMLGSKSSISTKDKILFLEDLDEYLYHIDRMMMNLKRNGYFEGLKGLIIGGMVHMHDNKIAFGKTSEEIILDITKDYNFPIAFNFPAGHIPDNRSLLFGKQVELEVNEKETILKM